jgi:hypothetical protein
MKGKLMKITIALAIAALCSFAITPPAAAADDATCRALVSAATREKPKFEGSRSHHPWMTSFKECRDAADVEIRAQVYDGYANYLTNHQRDGEAVQVLSEGIAIVEARAGADSPLLVPLLDDLGGELFVAGRRQDSLRLHQRALAIREKAFGISSAETVPGLMTVASFYLSTGEPVIAEKLVRRAWTIAKVSGCGADCPAASPLNLLYDAVNAQPGRESEAAGLLAELERESEKAARAMRLKTD